MWTFIIFIIYILIGIFVNYKYNKSHIMNLREDFPILSKIIITGLVLLWPALICTEIETYFINKNAREKHS